MSTGALFSKTNKKIGKFTIDAFINETHIAESVTTEFPVEFGADITDHVILPPPQFTVFGAVSNVAQGIFGTRFRLPTYLTGSANTRAASAYLALLEIRFKKEPITIQTGLISYRNMIMTSFVVDRDKTTSDALFFTAKFKGIIFANSQRDFLNSNKFREGATRNRNAAPVARGRVSNIVAPESEASAAKTWFNNLRGAV
jgi:hypothetical protein